MTEAMPFLQKYDITFLRPPTILAGDVAVTVQFHVGVAHSLTFGSRYDRHAG